jgi:hypothetical protein
MSAETFRTGSSENQSNAAGIIQAAGEVVKAVGNDQHVRGTLRKMGEHGLLGAGITKKSRFGRRSRIDEAGVRQAISDPKLALQGAAERTRKDMPRLTFYAGRAALGNILGRRSGRGGEASTPTPDFGASSRPSETSAPNVGALFENQTTATPTEVLFANEPSVPNIAPEYSAAPYSSSTAGTGNEKVTFTPHAAVAQPPVEQFPLPNTSTTARQP